MKTQKKLMPLALLALLLYFGTAQAKNFHITHVSQFTNLPGISNLYAHPIIKQQMDDPTLEDIYITFPAPTTYYPNGGPYDWTITYVGTGASEGNSYTFNTDISTYNNGGYLGQVPDGTYNVDFTCNDYLDFSCDFTCYWYEQDYLVQSFVDGDGEPNGDVFEIRGVTVNSGGDGIDIDPEDF